MHNLISREFPSIKIFITSIQVQRRFGILITIDDLERMINTRHPTLAEISPLFLFRRVLFMFCHTYRPL
jgi:hypothetical protein